MSSMAKVDLPNDWIIAPIAMPPEASAVKQMKESLEAMHRLSEKLTTEKSPRPVKPVKASAETSLKIKKQALAGMFGNDEGLRVPPDIKRKLDQAVKRHPVYAPAPPEADYPAQDSRRYLDRELLAYYPRNSQAGYGQPARYPGWLTYTNIQDLLARFFIGIHTEQGRIGNWREMCIGVTSFLPSGNHMPMFDYDGRNIKTLIRKDVGMLQEKHGFGEAWLYRTRKGFHVYFPTDEVSLDAYYAALKEVRCCPGFQKATLGSRVGAILRVSAKYTDFDIAFEQTIPSKHGELRRRKRKAHVVEALLKLGRDCGTHFASKYPQWACYQEDARTWKSGGRGERGAASKVIVPEDEYLTPNDAPEPSSHWLKAADMPGVEENSKPLTYQWTHAVLGAQAGTVARPSANNSTTVWTVTTNNS